MSNQSSYNYGGQHGYGQQWPPSYTPMLPLNYPPKPEQSSQNHLPSTYRGQPFEYNMTGINANGEVPGHGGQGLSISPHAPYMHNFGPSQTPHHISPVDMSRNGTMSFAPPPPPAALNPRAEAFCQPSGLLSRGRAILSTREEGEISEGETSSSSKVDKKFGKHRRSPRAPTTRHSDVEEGDAMATQSQDSSRSSSRMFHSNPTLICPRG